MGAVNPPLGGRRSRQAAELAEAPQPALPRKGRAPFSRRPKPATSTRAPQVEMAEAVAALLFG